LTDATGFFSRINTYRLTLRNENEQHSLIGISTGGGMREVIALGGFKVSLFDELGAHAPRGPDGPVRGKGRDNIRADRGPAAPMMAMPDSTACTHPHLTERKSL
jgi:hypothetical protein